MPQGDRMADDNPMNPAGWMAAMQKAQGDLMRQWSDLSAMWASQASAPGNAGTAPASGNTTQASADVAHRLMGQFEQYLGVTRSLWELLGKAASAAPEQRAQSFSEGLMTLQNQFSALFAPVMGASGAAANPWQGFGAAFGNLPGAPVQWPFSMAGAMPGWPASQPAAPWMSWPAALGPGREQQETWQRIATLGTRYTQAQASLATQWNQIITTALRDLGTKLTPRLQSGSAPGSMKEIYDLWVETAESAYSQAAHGAAFMSAQAELSNAMSQLRIAQRELIEEWARQFDLPTRAELNTLHQQMRQLTSALQKLGGL
jgi:class III poly(R)-hydroxyalkanoic acid synthase PhaE subunit